jgi:hypothetical protein
MSPPVTKLCFLTLPAGLNALTWTAGFPTWGYQCTLPWGYQCTLPGGYQCTLPWGYQCMLLDMPKGGPLTAVTGEFIDA